MSSMRNKVKYLAVDRRKLSSMKYMEHQTDDLKMKAKAHLDDGIFGIGFSPYLENQNPNDKDQISDVQIAERLEVIRPHTDWVRTFSCTNGNEVVPRIAHEKSLKTMVGVWIGDDLALNEEELSNAIEIGKQGHANIIAVGNEVLLRDDVEVEVLIEYIKRVKKTLPHIEVGYVDAYYTFINYPELVDVCDVILINCYPFWEHCKIDVSVEYMKEMYEYTKNVSKGKKIMITETGWPTKGELYGEALPSYDNAMRYFIETQDWAKKENIEVFYFSSFDEAWKVNHEGEYGAYWGIWDKDGKYKF